MKNLLRITLFTALAFILTSCQLQTKSGKGFKFADYENEATEQQAEIGSEAELKSDLASDSLLIQEITNKHTPSQILVRKGYIASYNKDTRCPNWVAWHLTAEHADGTVKRPRNAFHADEDVPEPRAEWYDYKRTGWARGHICPAGDNKWDEEAMRESFLMTNIVPQNQNLNDGDWAEIEKKCRKWAKEFGDIYIVGGPLPYEKPWETISDNEIVVPRAMFKVVLCLNGDKPKAIGFVYKNIAQNNPKSHYANTLKEVERLSGIKFFPTLPKKVRKEIDNSYNLSDWGIKD
jgi:endonuclease G